MLFPDLTRRQDIAELMDSAGALTERELSGALSTLAFVNRRFGGYRIVFDQLTRWLDGWPPGNAVSILDVGTGGGELPMELCRWGRRRGIRVTAVGIDSDPAVVQLARRRARQELGVEIVQASLGDYAHSGRRFDFVIASLMLHHVPETGIANALEWLDGLTARGLLISDLRRCQAGYLGALAVTSLFGDRVSRHDGPVSVRRAFTPAELQEAALRAGLPYLRARVEPPFRVTLSGLKTDG